MLVWAQLTQSVAISACVGDLNGDSGYVYSPARSLNLVSFHCEWERSGDTAMNKTIAFTLLNGTISKRGYQECYYNWNAVWFTTGESDETADFLSLICNVGGLMGWDEMESYLIPRSEYFLMGSLSFVFSRVCGHLCRPAVIKATTVYMKNSVLVPIFLFFNTQCVTLSVLAQVATDDKGNESFMFSDMECITLCELG
jgi:hypothetical protein